MPTKRASKAKSSTKKATKKKSSTAAAGMTIKMTPQQRAQLKKLSKGAIDAATIKIRPTVDVSQFLAKLATFKVARPTRGGIAPPPKDTYWV